MKNPDHRGLGTTATIAGLLGDRLYLVQVGDSRAYIVRGGVAQQITKDQSLMQRLIEAGELTPEEAEHSERRNIILQALGPEPTVKIDLTHQHVRRGDRLVLCTDGLSGQVRKDEIARVVAQESDLATAGQALIDRAVPHLITRDPQTFWTAGQWMTELTGGSDVGLSETVAKEQPGSETGEFRLYGRKWFTSAISSQIALTLARPEGNPPGGRGLALFYIETRDEYGRPHNIEINRLKDKLGTRKVPTAELTLNGTPAQLVMGTTDGVRNITPLLNITRLWNGISAVALMRRGLALGLPSGQGMANLFNEPPLTAAQLASLVSFGQVDGAYFIAMEHVRGCDLGTLLLGEPRGGERDRRLGQHAGDQDLLALENAHPRTSSSSLSVNFSGPCRGRRRRGSLPR